MEIITSHIHLDLDGFASMILAKKLYPNAKLIFSGNVSKNVKEIANLYQDILNIEKIKDIDLNEITKLIIVDTSNINRIGNFKNIIYKKNVEIIIYDHHSANNNDIKKGKIFKNIIGSNSSNILKYIFKKNIKLNNYEATIALMGIYEDTGNFTFKNTTYEDMYFASKLLKFGANLDMVLEFVNKNLQTNEFELFLNFLNSGETIDHYSHKIFITKIIGNKFHKNLDVIANKIMDIKDCDACFLLYSYDNNISIIARSTSKSIKLDEILKKFNGGGHSEAASGFLRNVNINEIFLDLKNEISNFIPQNKTAKYIMSTPVKYVKPDAKIKDVHKIMIYFGYSGIPVIKDDTPIGIISRRDIDKAIHHGFSNAPVKAYMTSNIIISTPNTSIEDLKKIIIENEIGRVPIVENNKLIGIVTRTDILRNLYEQKFILKKPVEKNPKIININLLNKFPKEIIDIFNIIEKVSKHRNEKAYLVGGIVRDLILNIKNLDIDIVIEGDAIAFAKELNVFLNIKKIITHEKFKTAIIFLETGLNIDLASSRLEYYEYPTSLPTVSYSSIDKDLYRRDFTINAMALEIDYNNFGKLIDYYNGYYDLINKKIKILHNLSFIEDPTRIIRAIRFASRYNFDIESDTEKFLIQAVNDGFLNKISFDRLKNEIIKILKDKNPHKALNLFEKFNIFEKFNLNIIITPSTYNIFKKVLENKDEIIKNNVKPWQILLITLFRRLNSEDLKTIFHRFGFKNKFIRKISIGINERKIIVEKLKTANKNSKIYFLLNNIPLEIIYLIKYSYPEIENKINLYLNQLQNIVPIINGKILLKNGYTESKKIKNIIKHALELQLDNENYTIKEILKELHEKHI
ncbi:tRNA nucleotidyltransferase (CCA-adding enzyme) [Hypnocyclicus thermotrophus]|uniref:tRNA nucleotidyltransferase (CCA-adding enzyme) n=1 Tax=Hypnocyclicus thermotrophus TaxID=1627895 RepID=A0AA46DZG8_9FUSO|nr:CBS domain-containing protein [Hypnocyclicus thermotrophus]TDT71785.1 tRNA nucleotidyltransferase (CCA-adding enzyme) [Hypnocyclicus thermotrophus]